MQKFAKVAVDTVVKFIKEKLPEPYASKLDDLIAGNGVEGIMKGLGGFLK